MSSTYSPNRRYVFARYAGLRRFRHWECRQDRRRGQQPVYQPAPGEQPEFMRVIDPENLLRVFDKLRAEGGEAPGIDGLTYHDFSRREIAGALKAVAQAIGQRCYRPRPTRQVRIPKASGGTRTLRLMITIDRIIAKAVQVAITPTLDPLFGPNVFGFRPRRNVQDMLLAIEKAAVVTDSWVIAQDDIRAAFDNVPVADVIADFRQHLGDEDLLWLVEALLRGAEGQNRTAGVDQGNAVSPVALLLRLHHALGLPQPADSAGAADPGNPPRQNQFQYADNLVYVCRSMTEGNQLLQRDQALLQAAGLDLKGEDGPPVNLKREGTRAEILGVEVRYGGNRLGYGLGKGAWNDLEQALERAHRAPDPVLTAKAVVQGWITAFGPAFEDVSERAALDGVKRAAARMGFRELGTEEELVGWLRRARQRWLEARGSALRGTGHGGTTYGVSTVATPTAVGDGAGSPTGARTPMAGAYGGPQSLQRAPATRSARQEEPPAAVAGEAGCCPGDCPRGSAAPVFPRLQDGGRS